MTLADRMRAAQLKGIKLTGLQATLIDPAAAYVSGGVTETPTEYAVWATPLFDESRRWLDPSITATIYISSEGLSVRPHIGWRLRHSGRTFTVVAVFANSVADQPFTWRLDVGEVAT